MSTHTNKASSPEAAARLRSPAGPSGPAGTNTPAPGFSRKVRGRCRVLHCPRPAELKWMSVPGQPNFLATWAVCGEHFVRLSAGERWASRRGRFPTFGRWLLMGTEIESCPRPDF